MAAYALYIPRLPAAVLLGFFRESAQAAGGAIKGGMIFGISYVVVREAYCVRGIASRSCFNRFLHSLRSVGMTWGVLLGWNYGVVSGDNMVG